MERTGTQILLDFIIQKQLYLKDYKTLIDPIRHSFNVRLRGTDVSDPKNEEAPRMLVERIIFWEEGHQFTTLENTINELFHIEYI